MVYFQNHMNALTTEDASAWYLTLKRKLYPHCGLLLLTVKVYSFPDLIGYFRHICRAPLTMGTLLVSAGAVVITPQRRCTRALQGSPQVFRRP